MKKQKPTVKKIEIERGLQERIEPEIGAFPLQFLRQEFSPHTYQVIDWHWHAGPQFCSVIRGNFHFRVLNRTLYLQEGDGIFINAQQVHTARPEKDSGQYLCLNLPLHLLELMSPSSNSPPSMFERSADLSFPSSLLILK